MPPTALNQLYRELGDEGIFVRRNDRLRHEGVHPLEWMVAAIHILAYGTAEDSLYEYLSM